MTSILELSLTRQYQEAADIFAREINAYHAAPMNDLTIYDADGPVASVNAAMDLVAPEYRNLFNQASLFHDAITLGTSDRHVPLHYHAHHFNFDENNKLSRPSYAVMGPIEREAPAFLYNPVDPVAKRDVGLMIRMAIDFDVATARLDSIVAATGWDREMVAKLNLVRSVENWSNRLVKGTPDGQLPPNYWEVYVSQVAAPLAEINHTP